jgi:hypothetical protein
MSVNKARPWICSRQWQNFGTPKNKRILTYILRACLINYVSAEVNQPNKVAEDNINWKFIRERESKSVCVCRPKTHYVVYHKHILISLRHQSFHFTTTDLWKTTLNLMPDVDISNKSRVKSKIGLCLMLHATQTPRWFWKLEAQFSIICR